MPKNHGHLVVQRRLLDVENPNELREALTKKQMARLGLTCKFLGKIFYEGDLICYDDKEWVCNSGQWKKTGNQC